MVSFEDEVKQNKAWDEAETHWIDNGTHIFTDAKTQRCVANGKHHRMTDACWTNLLAAYPQS